MMSCACLEGRGNSSSHIYDRSRFIIITWLGCTWTTARVDTAVDDNILYRSYNFIAIYGSGWLRM